MRMMMKVTMDREAGSRAIADGTMPRMLDEMLAQLNPEAAYFGPENGARTAFIVFDLQDPAQLPALSEPLWRTAAERIEMFPVMTRDDLRSGLGQLATAAAVT